MGVATGRDAAADELLSAPLAGLRLALPGVSVMEAWSAFEDERKRRGVFRQALDNQISQLRRDRTSAHAGKLLRLLEQAANENGDLLNDVERRLRETLAMLGDREAGGAAVELIPLTPEALTGSLAAGPTKDPTDDLLLAIILGHARQQPSEEKAFLSGNLSDFDTPEVRSLMSAVGITEYFARTQDFLGWFRARNPPAPG
jgi:hypothetical protein